MARAAQAVGTTASSTQPGRHEDGDSSQCAPESGGLHYVTPLLSRTLQAMCRGGKSRTVTNLRSAIGTTIYSTRYVRQLLMLLSRMIIPKCQGVAVKAWRQIMKQRPPNHP